MKQWASGLEWLVECVDLFVLVGDAFAVPLWLVTTEAQLVGDEDGSSNRDGSEKQARDGHDE